MGPSSSSVRVSPRHTHTWSVPPSGSPRGRLLPRTALASGVATSIGLRDPSSLRFCLRTSLPLSVSLLGDAEPAAWGLPKVLSHPHAQDVLDAHSLVTVTLVRCSRQSLQTRACCSGIQVSSCKTPSATTLLLLVGKLRELLWKARVCYVSYFFEFWICTEILLFPLTPVYKYVNL